MKPLLGAGARCAFRIGFVSSAFDRTRRWLAGFGDPDRLARTLATLPVELVVPRGQPDSEIAASLAATLLLRLDEAAPALHFVVPAARHTSLPRLSDTAPLADALAAEHADFESIGRFAASRAQSPIVRVSFGDSNAAEAVPVFASGWRVYVGRSAVGPPGNAVAAAYAGVLAAAEVVKAMLRCAGVRHRHLKPWTGAASLWDYKFPGDIGPAVGSVDLDGTAFVGCGGIASATAWVLGLLTLTGRPLAVDGDMIDVPNLNRHLTASHADANGSVRKVDALAAVLDAAGAATVPRFSGWQDLDPTSRSGVETVVISVDDDATRRDVQLDLPRLVLNAGNADSGLYRVTRHDFAHGACLRCISRGEQRSRGPEESAARRLGLRLEDVEPFLAARRPLPESVLARASITEDERDLLRGLDAREALGVVCGRFKPLPELPALSMPPLSAAPGVLLAGELVKSGLAAGAPLDKKNNTLTAGLLAGPHARWLSARSKQPGCECTEPAYRIAYRRRWQVQS